MRVLAWFGRKQGRFRVLPFASGWTKHRDLPAPQGSTFQEQWRERGRS
jgi:L-lactate dehydrogenase complex protein LldF